MQGGFYRTAQPLITNDEARDGRKCPRHRGGAREGFQTFCLRFQHLSHALPRCLGVAGEPIPAISLSRRIMLQHWGCCGGEKGGGLHGGECPTSKYLGVVCLSANMILNVEY